MSAEPRPRFYPPEPPSRFRWVPPLCLGIALGGIIGCLATVAFTALAQQSRARDVAAENFSPSNLLSAIPGAGDVTFSGDTTEQLGRMDSRGLIGSAIRRRIRIQGSILKGADAGNFAQQLRAQIDTELRRLGVSIGGNSMTSSSGPDEAKESSELTYFTLDDRRGHVDFELTVHNGRVEGTLILTEGR